MYFVEWFDGSRILLIQIRNLNQEGNILEAPSEKNFSKVKNVIRDCGSLCITKLFYSAAFWITGKINEKRMEYV